jgi:hypothetical protein
MWIRDDLNYVRALERKMGIRRRMVGVDDVVVEKVCL